ncbi:MAG: valine--tRNA ligase [Algisphaera sp.]
MQELSPQYDPQAVESLITERWNDAQCFHAEPTDAGDPYSIVIPPPNVTAALHLGHALNNTLQDVLTRVARMRGMNACWLPGTDHAGIATQSVVDKRLQAEGKKAIKEYKKMEAQGGNGREQFLEKVTAWKDQYEARITQQLKDMGCSCDWERQAFTMDEPRATAVREAFFRLFKEGLIYRGKRLVNWDPVTQTALADDEVEMEDVDGHFWYMKYPVCDATGAETGAFVTVATTRPETMLGDTGVAVNPNDAPRAKFIGQFVKLPIVGRVIPIVGDDYVVIPDEESADSKARMASGFLKVTPAHDVNDFEIGRRHDLAVINIMAPDASISTSHGWDDASQACDPFVGLSREDARRAVVRWFKEADLLEDQKPYKHAVGHSYRSHVPVEPYYSDQWYLKVTDDKLAGAALRAMDVSQRQPSDNAAFNAKTPKRQDAKEGKADTGLKFYPERYAKTFQNWHENLRDWCISRQLWWGHRIPVWSLTCSDEQAALTLTNEWNDANPGSSAARQDGDTVFVCLKNNDAVSDLEKQGFIQDPDVLDTWFSSALWPMSTLGWPEKTDDLATWNPSSVLCTAREIITLWVSRMVMFNLYFEGQLPFKDVFIHAMIQDGHGQKMSKSLGNGVDPIDIIHSHGCDAMRYTLTAMTTQTQDLRMPVDLIDPHSGEAFTPKFVTGPGGYKVAAPEQDSPSVKGKKMASSYGVASGKVKPSDDLPAARNTSEKFDLGQRLANKLWNATRFTLSILTDETPTTSDEMTLADRWILDRLAETVAAADAALGEYRFAEFATGLYDFFWRDLCDWYLESIKPTVRENAAQRRTLAACIDATLRLLHPVMPFITERLWESVNEALPGDRSVPGLALPPNTLLVKAAWPVMEAGAMADASAAEDFAFIQSVVSAIREIRSQHQVAPSAVVEVSATGPAAVLERMAAHRPIVQSLARYTTREVGTDAQEASNAAAALVGDMTLYVHDVVDTEAEKARLSKRRDTLAKQIVNFEKRLGNEKYVNSAPAKLVQETRDQFAAAARELEAVEAQMAALG